ncbi:hypothetical protein HEP75_02855 [Xanthomonas sp. SI]|nr:hypothetical protein HEP75_02855 [Xanthomonas sp. SI]
MRRQPAPRKAGADDDGWNARDSECLDMRYLGNRRVPWFAHYRKAR